jgi:hypothetical protein
MRHPFNWVHWTPTEVEGRDLRVVFAMRRQHPALCCDNVDCVGASAWWDNAACGKAKHRYADADGCAQINEDGSEARVVVTGQLPG